MKKVFSTTLICLFLASCSSGELKAPCPDFGAHCYKKPINAWNYKNAAVF